MSDSVPTSAAWKRPQTLPDGRVVEWVWGLDGGEALDVGVGHRRIEVSVLIDGEFVTLPVVLTPKQIEEALRNGIRECPPPTPNDPTHPPKAG